MSRRGRQPGSAWLAARQVPAPCSHRFSDWTWVPERARWEGLCKLCGWSHIATPEMAAALERDVAAYCDSHPIEPESRNIVPSRRVISSE